MSPAPQTRRSQQGFTLVELMIVVVILGILATIVIPQLASGADEAKRSQFTNSLKSIVTACQLAKEVNGYDIEDASTGNLPTELQPFLQASAWERPTPLGGRWDSEKGSFGVASAVGVHFDGGDMPTDAEMLQVDAMIDDGTLSTGAFRKLASDRFYFVLTD